MRRNRRGFTLNSAAGRTDNPVLGVLSQQVALQALPRLRAPRGEAPAGTQVWGELRFPSAATQVSPLCC